MTGVKPLWPRLSPEINFGHLLQAAVILVTIGGGAITSYLAGDILTVVAPTSPDATLANLAWTFVGSH